MTELVRAGYIAELRAERDALKAALRRFAIHIEPDWDEDGGLCGETGTCLICGKRWYEGNPLTPERHAAGCLAAPEDTP